VAAELESNAAPGQRIGLRDFTPDIREHDMSAARGEEI
jgi:hypothetical protein